MAAGDNAVITRPFDAGGLWIHDNRSHAASDIVRRGVTLLEVATVTNTPPAGTGAADSINGDDGADQLFGQAGDDTVNGGADDDYAEGNVGADTINGNTGRDDLVGGGSANDGVISATSVGNGLIDGADTMHGNESGDVVSGDNARIARQPASAGSLGRDAVGGRPEHRRRRRGRPRPGALGAALRPRQGRLGDPVRRDERW